ncbi:MAG TPA: hypothetical protein VNW05_09155 [Steroidobacteraceae bacterium]|nr:hypothetical protein [Steroidobacteraceae bacterium]HXB00682.1 hypothetical protein [Steroidobacteraceae bacterium]
MPDEPMADELDDYLHGGSDISQQYKRDSSPVPPHELDRLVLNAAGSPQAKTPFRPQSLAPLAFAASVFLSLALVLAMLFSPQVKKPDDKPQVVRVRIFKSEPPRATPASVRERNPVLWLEDINALRRAGRGNEADLEMRRFRSAYPDYIIPISE